MKVPGKGKVRREGIGGRVHSRGRMTEVRLQLGRACAYRVWPYLGYALWGTHVVGAPCFEGLEEPVKEMETSINDGRVWNGWENGWRHFSKARLESWQTFWILEIWRYRPILTTSVFAFQ